MSNHIKSFESFTGKDLSYKKDSLLEFDFDLSKMLGGAIDFLGPGAASAVEQKLVEFLLNKLGIKPDTTASMIIQEVVEAIPAEDYLDILSGEKLNMAYLNPYLAEALTDSIKRKGLDTIFRPIAENFGLDPNGLLMRTISESFEALGEEELKKRISNLIAFLSSIEFSAGEYVSTLDDDTKKQLSSGIGKALSAEGPLQSKRAKELKATTLDRGDESGFLSGFFNMFSKPGKMQDSF
jgi:hypothetical protein